MSTSFIEAKFKSIVCNAIFKNLNELNNYIEQIKDF